MYYLQSRYYDPEVCRFINADSMVWIDEFLKTNLYVYCANSPIDKVDYSGTDGQTVELGRGWHYRIDSAKTSAGTQRHIHIWNDKNGKSYSQNDDGSPHDKGKNSGGKLPKWINKSLVEKAGWDYNGKHSSFFSQTECSHDDQGIEYAFADGTKAYIPIQNSFVYNDLETIYRKSNQFSTQVSINRPVCLPIIEPVTFPSFPVGFGIPQLIPLIA